MNRKLLLRLVVNTFSHTFAATIQLLVHGFEGKLAAVSPYPFFSPSFASFFFLPSSSSSFFPTVTQRKKKGDEFVVSSRGGASKKKVNELSLSLSLSSFPDNRTIVRLVGKRSAGARRNVNESL